MATEPTYRMEGEITEKELILIIQGWFKYLISQWRVLIFAILIGGTVGLIYSFLKQPIFTAKTTFVLESNDSRGGLSRLSGVAALVGVDFGGDAGGLFQGDNILELYKSRKMLAQTLLSRTYIDSSELLIERYINIYDLRDDWKDRPELLALDFKKDPKEMDIDTRRLREGVISSIVSKINSDILTVDKPEKNLSILRVEVASVNEVFSKSFNENLVRRVNEFYVQTKTKKSIDNIAILEKKVDSVRAVMNEAIYSAARVSDATPNLNPTRQVQRLVPSQEAQFSAETNKIILSQLLQNLELTKMTLLQEQPLIQLVDQPIYPLSASRLGKSKGVIIGSFLFGVFAIFILCLRKYYYDIITGQPPLREKSRVGY